MSAARSEQGFRNRGKTDNQILTSVQNMIQDAMDILGYGSDLFELLKEPKRILKVRIPVRMDHGKVQVFTGYRAQYMDAVGPTKGGVLMHPDVNEDQVKALSMWNGIKSSILSLPFGGAKGGVVCDPRTMSFRELEHLTRGYIRAISSVIGPAKDIPAMDPFSSPQLMSWMADEYRNTHPGESASFITGKPIVLGGLRGRDTAIADGMVSFIRETAHIRRLDLKSSGMIVQGFGSAGSLIAKSLYDSGVRIVGISDAYGALYNPDGLQMDELLNSRDSFGTVTKLFEHTITNKELLEKPCDILVLAAIENQITESNAKKIRARAVIEGTGGAISDKGAQMLEEENILVIPEIIAGAGDVAFSYLEWARHLQGNIWTDQEVGKKLSQILTGALHDVSETAKERKVIMKKAALLVGIERLAEAVRYRGWV